MLPIPVEPSSLAIPPIIVTPRLNLLLHRIIILPVNIEGISSGRLRWITLAGKTGDDDVADAFSSGRRFLTSSCRRLDCRYSPFRLSLHNTIISFHWLPATARLQPQQGLRRC